MNIILQTYVVLAFLLSSIESFPQGAGGCDGGQAAVGESHLSNVNGYLELTLSDANIKVSIASNEIQEGSRFGILVGESYPITVEGEFKGVLIRIEPDVSQLNTTTVTLTPGTNAKVADVCDAPVVGITHFDSTVKSEFSGSLRSDEPLASFVDITVVLQNNETGSTFAYGSFNLLFVDSAPTPAPSFSATVPPTPTESEICFVCGSDSLDVSPNLTTVIDGVVVNCEDLSQDGLDGLIDPIDCTNATFAAQQDCECAPVDFSQPPTTVSPTISPTTKAPTTAPIPTPAPVPVETPAPVPVPTPPPTKTPTKAPEETAVPEPPSGDSGDECPSSKNSKSGKSGKLSKSSKCRKMKKKKSESKRSSNKIKKSKSSNSSTRRLRASA